MDVFKHYTFLGAKDNLVEILLANLNWRNENAAKNWSIFVDLFSYREKIQQW
jgi:hypothetical protein